MSHCNICKDRDINIEGINLADSEVVPLFKSLLNIKYTNHPFPRRYGSIYHSILCYSQALQFNRAHNIRAVYYTDNKYLLKFSQELADSFDMATKHTSEMPENYFEVCEYNTQT